MEPLTFKAAPLGACVNCIRQLADGGKPGSRHELPDGRVLIGSYCHHHEAGFYGLAVDGAIDSWTIKSGMPIEEWHLFINALPENMAAGMRAIADDAAERRQSLN